MGQVKLQSYWLNYNSTNSFIMAGSNIGNIVQVSNSAQVFHCSVICMRGPCVEMSARLCFLNLSQLGSLLGSLLGKYLLSQGLHYLLAFKVKYLVVLGPDF